MAKTQTPDIADIDLDAMLADLDAEEVIAANEEPETKVEAKESPVDDDLDGLLEELDLEAAAPVKASTEGSVELDELEELLGEVEATDAKKDNSDLYSEDEVDEVVEAAPQTKASEVESNKKKAAKNKDATEEKAKAPEPEKKAAPKKEKKTGSRSVKVDPGLPTSEILTTKLGESGKNLLFIEEGVRLDMAVVDAMPKKVKEKLINLYMHLHNGVALSTYASRGLSLIVDNGEATTAQLIESYQEKWSKGTSSSQVGQIVRLFKDLKICTVEGKTLSPNSKSKLLPLITIEKTEETEA